jgi:serine/threonine-protein kinase
VSLKELPLPSLASLRAIAALRSPHLALVRPARIGLGFESAGGNQKSLADVEQQLGGPGRLSLSYSLRWLLDVLTGLGVLHRTLGFVHGELQPEHVVLGEDGVGRVIPVVRAHWVRGEERSVERLYYLAPEKLLGDRLDVRSDVFSVGVMLWEALAGQPLLEADNVDDIIARLMGGGIPRARPPEGETWSLPLAEIADRAISVDPSRRYDSVSDMKDALQNACARYLASAPGMVELFINPELRARSSARDSLPPESQRITVPPTRDHEGVGETEAAAARAEAPDRVDSNALEAAAERLSRSSFSSIDLEDELTTRPNITPPPNITAAASATTSTSPPSTSSPEPSSPEPSSPEPSSPATSSERAPSRRPLGDHGKTLMGVAPPFIPRRTPPGMNVTRPVGTPLPVITPRGSTPAPSHERAPESPRPPTLAPMVAPRPAPGDGGVEPSFELVTPRKRRSGIWLALGAAAAVSVFAARPWLARQVAAATGAIDSPASTYQEPPRSELEAPHATTATIAPTAAPTDQPVGISSTPPSPTDREGPRPRLQRREQQQLGQHEASPHPSPPTAERRAEAHNPPPAAPAPIEPKAATPAAEEPPPPPPPPPAPKPKAVPTSEADRYGI